jgi:DNA-binding transcriptional LysR family regulator
MSRMAVADRRRPWRLIEVRHLTALAAIAREGTLGDAALSLGYVQSAVSGQLAMLERLVGAQLVERSRGHGNNQELTPAGALLLAHSEEIFMELKAARAGITQAAEHERPGLRIGVAPGVADAVVGPVLAVTLDRRVAPELGEVDTIDRADILDALLADEFDVVLVSEPLEHPEIAVAEIGRYPMVLASTDPQLSLDDLATTPLVVWREGEEPSRVERELAAAGIEPYVVARADASDTAVVLALDGLGAALVPACAIGPGSRLTTIDCSDLLAERYTGVAWARERTADERVRRFVALACALRAERA